MTSKVLLLAGVLALPAWQAAPARPKVFLLDADRLVASRAAVRAGDAGVRPAWTALRAEADKALTLKRFSVTDKTVAPPSGDKHDYLSQAPYFWPNPATPNHLPYVRRDGERNPEINGITDHATQDGMANAVRTLALAAYLGGDDRYAEKAAGLLRAWYLDPATRMNPNLEYAQFVPGVNTGRGIGLIETRGLARLVDAIGLLDTARAWTAADDRGVREWYGAFLQWMIESKNGRDESASKNNHGTYYDVQIAAFSLFLDRPARAREVIEAAKQKRITAQIEADGRQPLELARTNSWGYSAMNLEGWLDLATLGERVGVDLWHFQTSDGRSIRAAVDYLAPFALDGRRWPHEQITALQPDAFSSILRRAAAHDPEHFTSLAARLPATSPADRSALTGR